MIKFAGVFAAVTLSLGVAQASAVYINTFDLGQVFVGGPGPAAPAVDTPFGNAVTVDALGITFDFAEGPSALPAMYGDTTGTAGNGLAPLSDPVLDGPSDGTLTLNFAFPTDFVSFDIVYGIEPLDSGGTVTIGATPMPFATTGNQGSGGFFSIGSFSSGTLAPFSQAVITFGTEPGSTQFAIDNLSFDTPEPGSLTLLVAGTLLLGALLRVRRFPLRASNRP
jgi:hypothetical protein